MTLRHVKSGDPLVLPAATFNAFVDAAQAHRDSGVGTARTAKAGRTSSDLVIVKNDSGADVSRFGVLGISTYLIDPADNLAEFQNRPAITGSTPATADTGTFVIVQEPIANGSLGLGLIAGVTPVKVNVSDTVHERADVSNGQNGYLASAGTGAAQILAIQSGTGEKWALVRLGAVVFGTSAAPAVLDSTGEAANTDTWNINEPPEGTDGVQFVAFRLYWSGTSGEPVYQFIRTPTYDSLGNLVAVSTEIRSVAFATGPCEGS